MDPHYLVFDAQKPKRNFELIMKTATKLYIFLNFIDNFIK